MLTSQNVCLLAFVSGVMALQRARLLGGMHALDDAVRHGAVRLEPVLHFGDLLVGLLVVAQAHDFGQHIFGAADAYTNSQKSAPLCVYSIKSL